MDKWTGALSDVLPSSTPSREKFNYFDYGLELSSEDLNDAPSLDHCPSASIQRYQRAASIMSKDIELTSDHQQDDFQRSNSILNSPRRFLNVMKRNSLTDVTAQSTVYDMSIRLDQQTNLCALMSSKLATRLSKFYLSQLGLSIMIIVVIAGAVVDLWILPMLFFSGLLLIVNRVVLRYMLTHSFDVYFLFFSTLLLSVCDTALRWPDTNSGLFTFNQCCYGAMLMLSVLATQCIDGFDVPTWIKQVSLLMAFGAYFMILIQPFFQFGEYRSERVDELSLTLPFVDELSIREIMIGQAIVIFIFSARKLVFSLSHPDAIWVASYPQLLWSAPAQIADKLVANAQKANRARRRMRSLTLSDSMDIFKQNDWQKINIYLKKDNNNLHRYLGKELGDTVQALMFSKWNMALIIMVASLLLVSAIFEWMASKLILEVLSIALLSSLICLADRKIVKYALTSFDLVFTLINWMFYVIADFLWCDQFREDMNAVLWLDNVGIKVVCSQVILIIAFSDGLNIARRWKAIFVIMVFLISFYVYICLLLQVYVMNPERHWTDKDVTIVGEGKQSLRMFMVRSLSNIFIIMGKHIAIIKMHPGKAMMEIYPRIEWIRSRRDSDASLEFV